jgi:hypothetical protein
MELLTYGRPAQTFNHRTHQDKQPNRTLHSANSRRTAMLSKCAVSKILALGVLSTVAGVASGLGGRKLGSAVALTGAVAAVGQVFENVSWIDFLGFVAALSVLSSFCMTTIVPLRTIAVLSNILFLSYGLFAHIPPVFVLHMTLLPVNLAKLHRIYSDAQPPKLSRPQPGLASSRIGW